MPNTGPNPLSRYISYDNFGWALLTSLQLVTMDYWESIYNSVSTVSERITFLFPFVCFSELMPPSIQKLIASLDFDEGGKTEFPEKILEP